jgi:hypothetical protein
LGKFGWKLQDLWDSQSLFLFSVGMNSKYAYFANFVIIRLKSENQLKSTIFRKVMGNLQKLCQND